MHGLSVCERLRQFRKLFALLVLEIYANYVDRWRGSDRTRESLAKAKTVCRGRKLHARNRLTVAVNDSTFKYIYIYFSLVLYRFFSIGEKKISFSSRMSKRSKKRTSFVGLHSLVRFFPFNIYSLSQLCHYIVCSNALRSVCVSHRECVWFISFYSVYLLHFFPLFLRGTGCAGEEVSIVFLRILTPRYHIEGSMLSSRAPREFPTFLLPVELWSPVRGERERTAVYLFQNERASSNSRLWKTILLGLLA